MRYSLSPAHVRVRTLHADTVQIYKHLTPTSLKVAIVQPTLTLTPTQLSSARELYYAANKGDLAGTRPLLHLSAVSKKLHVEVLDHLKKQSIGLDPMGLDPLRPFPVRHAGASIERFARVDRVKVHYVMNIGQTSAGDLTLVLPATSTFEQSSDATAIFHLNTQPRYLDPITHHPLDLAFYNARVVEEGAAILSQATNIVTPCAGSLENAADVLAMSEEVSVAATPPWPVHAFTFVYDAGAGIDWLQDEKGEKIYRGLEAETLDRHDWVSR